MQNSTVSKNNFLKIFTKAFLICMLLVALSLGLIYGARFYNKSFREIITLKKTANVEAKEVVTVDFSVPVLKTDYLAGIKIIPSEKIQLNFDTAKRKLTLTPQNNWQPGTKYTVYFPAGKSAMLTDIMATQMNFSVASFPQVANVMPQDGAQNVLIGAEDPIVVNFTKSTKGYFIKFVLNPDSDVLYQFNSEKTQFKLLPKTKIQDGTGYSLEMYAKIVDAPDSAYQKIYTGTFTTLPAQPIAWEKDFTLRLAQAQKYAQAKITVGKYIDVNLETQIMSAFENGKLLNVYLISSGKRGLETPKGDHQIYNKSPRAYSKAYGLYMPNWMAILPDGKVGIHELPEWPGGYKEGANHLGTPVSHGCIRLGVGAAKTVYDWAEIGTPVIVY